MSSKIIEIVLNCLQCIKYTLYISSDCFQSNVSNKPKLNRFRSFMFSCGVANTGDFAGLDLNMEHALNGCCAAYFCRQTGGKRGGEAPRRDSKRSKDTNLAPTRPSRPGGGREGEAGFLCQSNKRRVSRRGGVCLSLCPGNTHAQFPISNMLLQCSVMHKIQNMSSQGQKIAP